MAKNPTSFWLPTVSTSAVLQGLTSGCVSWFMGVFNEPVSKKDFSGLRAAQLSVAHMILNFDGWTYGPA